MIKETVVAMTVVTMAAGAALVPSAVSATETPIVVADSHEACNPCNPCNPCAADDEENACNPCNPCAAE